MTVTYPATWAGNIATIATIATNVDGRPVRRRSGELQPASPTAEQVKGADRLAYEEIKDRVSELRGQT